MLIEPKGRSGHVTENLAPSEVQISDHPARKESLYRLHYQEPDALLNKKGLNCNKFRYLRHV